MTTIELNEVAISKYTKLNIDSVVRLLKPSNEIIHEKNSREIKLNAYIESAAANLIQETYYLRS